MEITLFNYAGANDIRTLTDESDDPWFVAKDVCDVLDIRSDTVSYILDSDEIMKVNPNTIGVASGGHKRILINESGLYSLILRSRKPEAKAFKKWITSEVLPSIRKKGGYMVGEEKVATGEMSEDEFIFKAMTMMQGKIERLSKERDEALGVVAAMHWSQTH